MKTRDDNGKLLLIENLLKWSTVVGLKSHKNTIDIFNDKTNPISDPRDILNSAGHRGPDFKSSVEFLAVGCSVTYGIGLDHSDTWAYHLARIMGISDNYNVLGYPGKSLQFMQRQILEYFNEYGLPKRLILIAPDQNRPDYFGLDEGIIGIKKHNREFLEKRLKNLELEYVLEDVNEDWESGTYVGSTPYLAYLASTSLVQISRICKLLNVELYWTSWSRYDLQTAEHLIDIDLDLKNSYVELRELDGNLFFKDSNEYPNCHEEQNTDSRFYIADDQNHWGRHYHIHMAEDLANAIDLRHGH